MMRIGNRENLFSLGSSDGDPAILNISAADLEQPDVLQVFLELAEQGQFRQVVDSLYPAD
jgi:hypothetical protein